MDGMSGLVVSFLIFNGLPIRTSADGQWSRPKTMAPSPGDAATDGSSRPSEWPCRLGVPRTIRPKILELWAASPTFQRQCTRLAGAKITVAVGLSPLLRPGSRAVSRILRRNGHVFFVSTTLRDDMHVEEDLPHELEHVMEQSRPGTLPATARRGAGRGLRAPTPTRPNAPVWRASAQRTKCKTLEVRARCSRCSPVPCSRRNRSGSLVPQSRPQRGGQGACSGCFVRGVKWPPVSDDPATPTRTVAGLGTRRRWRIRPVGAARPRRAAPDGSALYGTGARRSYPAGQRPGQRGLLSA